MSGPTIVLVGTTLPENIGAAARAMANFGLNDLRLVQPACDPLHANALALATHGESVLRGARVYTSLAEALADRVEVWATTALPRTFRKPTMNPRAAALRWGEDSAVVFGPERSGLTYDELTWAHALLTFPTDAHARALNLGVSVALVAWEWRCRDGVPDTVEPDAPAPMDAQLEALAGVEHALLERGWAQEPGLRVRTLRSLRTAFLRARLRPGELTLLRGVLKLLAPPR